METHHVLMAHVDIIESQRLGYHRWRRRAFLENSNNQSVNNHICGWLVEDWISSVSIIDFDW